MSVVLLCTGMFFGLPLIGRISDKPKNTLDVCEQQHHRDITNDVNVRTFVHAYVHVYYDLGINARTFTSTQQFPRSPPLHTTSSPPRARIREWSSSRCQRLTTGCPTGASARSCGSASLEPLRRSLRHAARTVADQRRADIKVHKRHHLACTGW
jgi:hypothetical protein